MVRVLGNCNNEHQELTMTDKSRLDQNSVQAGFLRLLIEDVLTATNRRIASDTQTNRRELVRSTFAAIEGAIWDYRKTVISAARDLGLLTIDEEAALTERTVQIGQNGNLSKQDRFIPMLSAFRFVSRIAQRIDASIELNFNESGWHQVRQAVEIRNRVTHPKALADLAIEQADLDACSNALYWLLENHLIVVAATNSALKSFVDQARELVVALKVGDPKAISDYVAAQTMVNR
jgi:hypothetical protein